MEKSKKKDRFRHAVFGVAYSVNKSDGKIEYIILKRKNHWKGWEFPKGKIEKFESKRRAAKREIEEETGRKVLKIKRFRDKGRYFYRKKIKDRPEIIGQTYKLFAAEVEKGDGKVTLDKKEHSGYNWVDFKEAQEMLTWEDQRKCLKIVNDWLTEKK